MKRNSILSATAAIVLSLGALSTFAQPGRNGGPGRPDYDYRPNQMPAAPYVIVDGDGHWSNDRNYRFNNYNKQDFLSRKQQKRLEKHFGFVPPLIMYVPDRLVDRSGIFVYRNGIVYNRSRDGYFHLDQRYYNGDRWDDYNKGWSNNYKYRN